MVTKGNYTSLPMLSKKIKVCFGWDESPPTNHVVSCKSLRNKGLHTYLGMVGYCMKDNGEECLEFVHTTVTMEDMNEDKMEYAKFGKVGLKNHANLSHSNILRKAHQWDHFFMKKHLGVSLYSTLFYMWIKGNSTTWGVSIEIHGYEYEEFGFHMEENDESS